MQRADRARSAFTLVELLVVIAIIGVLVALLLPAVQAARESSRRIKCTNQLRQLGIGCQQFHDTFKRLPYNGQAANNYGRPDVQPSGSWCFSIMPFIELKDAYTAAQGRANYDPAFHNTRFPIFLCPTRGRIGYKPDITTNQAGSSTDYVINPRINIPNNPPTNLNENAQPDQNRNFAFITDGTSHTFLLGEKALQVAQYRDLLTSGFDETLWKGGAGGTARGRNTTMFNTGQPSPAIVQDSPTVTHGNRWGSPHPGTCLFLLVDGSIRGVKYGADPMPAMLPNDDRLLDTD